MGNGLLEKDVNLIVAKKLAAKLRCYENIVVKLTRDSDKFIGLSDRAKFANDLKADFFLSIHVNAGGGTGYWLSNSVIEKQCNGEYVASLILKTAVKLK